MSSDEAEDELLPKPNEEIVGKKHKYTTSKLLGKGGYGAVFEVVRKTDGKKFAMKCEKTSNRKQVLKMDCRVIRRTQLIKSKHFCFIEDTGKLDSRFVFVCMKLIGANLWDLRVDRSSMRFTMGTAIKAADQCLIAIEELHRVGFLHRDIKPGNFAAGREDQGEQQIVFMLDFGLCRQFREKDKDIRVPRDNAPFRGTTRYAPIAAMKQMEQSRKEDLEGWLYMVAEWTSGGLPWKKYKADNRDEVLKCKEELRTSADALDKFLINSPKREFERILKYIDDLTYFSIPDYVFVHNCLIHALKANNIKMTDPLDWDPHKEYHGPCGPPGDGRLIDLKDEEDDHEEGVAAGNTKKSAEKIKTKRG